MKEEYALLGTYEHADRNNIEIIAMSNDYDELTKIKDAIEIVNEKLIGIDREFPTDEVEKIIEERLDSVDIRDSVTGYVQDIHITGIFKIEEVEPKIINLDGHLKIPHLWPGQTTPATELFLVY